MSLFEHIEQKLDECRLQGLWRERRVVGATASGDLVRDDQVYLNFSSNDYLGLSQHPRVIEALKRGAERHGTGSRAASVVTGYSDSHARLEQTLAQILGCEAALLFCSGFSANQAVIKALLGAEHKLWQDKLNHASLQEAGMLSPAKMLRFRHNDMAHLEKLLTKKQGLVVSEGVFSMDGDEAPVKTLARLCHDSGNWLMIDDAHGFGVLGPRGEGTVAAHGVSPDRVALQTVTFGKALGVMGAAIVGSRQLIDYLVNFSRNYLYSTAMPAAQCEAVLQSLTLSREGEYRQQLKQRIALFRREAALLGLPVGESRTPIQPLLLKEVALTQRVSEALRRRGIWLYGIRPPTVPAGQARLRIALNACHQPGDIERLLTELHAILKAEGYDAV
ncbi:8-amino-7-oxononanoate synthase [Dongshaea marina]|uniref:8-amino-7-oxononanoate synthase n=1 Tax=Dongshaea marina TaxID=2047966 RepID=UPI000D3E8DB5|nr:8-amino-7-oxononanoate synthase [Dongshaea marina]